MGHREREIRDGNVEDRPHRSISPSSHSFSLLVFPRFNNALDGVAAAAVGYGKDVRCLKPKTNSCHITHPLPRCKLFSITSVLHGGPIRMTTHAKRHYLIAASYHFIETIQHSASFIHTKRPIARQVVSKSGTRVSKPSYLRFSLYRRSILD